MSIRPKTKRRVFYLALGCAIALCVAAGVYRYGMYSLNKKIMQAKADGMAAFNDGDYPTAIDKLSFYVTKRKNDPEALLAFGIARSKVPTLDGSHISHAITIFRHYCDIDPNNIEAQHLLIELEAPYTTYAAAALENARDLLRTNPGDLTALKAITQIHMRERLFTDALDAAKKYTDADPTDLEMQQRELYLMQKVGQPASDLHARADALSLQYPNDPRFLIVQATAYYFGTSPTDSVDKHTQDVEKAGKLVLEASQKDPPDPQFVSICVVALDQVGQFPVSQDLLNRAVVKFNDPLLMRMLVQRLWQDHKWDDVVAKLANLDPNSPKTDVDLLAYEAMSLYELHKKDQAAPFLAALDAHDNDQTAVAWAITIRQRYVDVDATPKDRLEHYQEALQHDPNNPVIQYLLGDTYWHMGENDLALQQFGAASDGARSWAEPHVRVAEVLASQGRGGVDAINAAERALITSSKGQGEYDYQAVIAQLLVRFAHAQNTGDPQEIQDLLTDIQNVQKQRPGEPETLPIYVKLLLQTGQRDQAVETIQEADKRADQSGEDLLLKLAELSHESQLGMETEIYAAIERQFGVTPRLAFARALQLLQAGHTADGLTLLTDAKANDKNSAPPQQWDQIICQYREVSRDPGAPAAWAALGDAYPKDLVVQQAILYDEQSGWSNRPLIDRAIRRLQDLTGDEAAGWKIARARWLLDGDDPQRDASAAVVLLTDVLKSSTSEAGPHELLAMAYEKLQDMTDAVNEWHQAFDLAPRQPRIVFGYLRALDITNQTDESRVVFDKFIEIPNIPPNLALQASILIASEGDAHRAQALLTEYPNATDQELHDATLAKVDRLLGQLNDAATIYFKLADAPALQVGTIREASDFFAAQHDLPAARKFLTRLDGMTLPPGQRELILADFEERYGDLGTATQLYADAAKASTDDSSNAIQQIGFLLRQRNWAQAKSAIDAALSRWPNDNSLNGLASVQAALSASPDLVQQLGGVVDAVTRDPLNSAAVDTLRAVAASANLSPDDRLKNYSDLISKYPNFLPLYDLAVQQMIALRQINDAVTLANSAVVQFPESPEAARICAQTYAAVGRWNDVVTAAARWRERSADHPLKADLLIALADLFVNQPGDAVDRLASYIPDAKADPDNNEELITNYCEALIRSGNEADAIALLHPLAEKSAKWRANWLKIAAFSHPDSASAIAWIDQIKPLLDPKSLDDQREVADAYFDIAEHRQFSKAFEFSRDALQPFVDASTADVPALLTYALACGNLNDDAGAEKAYRQILKLQPNQPVALNNLADMLRLRDDHDSLAESESLARRAIAAQPSDPNTANFYDTLARVLLREGRTDDAIAAFAQGDLLDPRNFSVLIGMADACAHAHRTDDAIRYLARIDGLLSSTQLLPPNLQTELADARAEAAKPNNPVSASSPGN